MLVIIDYGMGNLASVFNAFKKIGVLPVVSSDVSVVKKAEYLVLPGVGAFEDAIKNLRELGLDKCILEHIESGKPFLGICLGLHLLFEKSYENGQFRGLGVLKGEVVRFNVNLPVPHMGWNSVKIVKHDEMINGIKDGSYFYFDHSYYVRPSDDEVVILQSEYGVDFVVAIKKENVMGFQFHPEKSHNNGLKLLENFKNFKRYI